MKDIRLVELDDGEIGLFTRPQGLAYRAKTGRIADVGFTVLPGLAYLSEQAIVEAPVLDGLFRADEWGGVNQAYMLKDGRIGVIGHIAYSDEPFSEEMTSIITAQAGSWTQSAGGFSICRLSRRATVSI